jgi:hypothetical protein
MGERKADYEEKLRIVVEEDFDKNTGRVRAWKRKVEKGLVTDVEFDFGG